MQTHDDGCVSSGVFRDDDAVALLLPLRGLVLHIGDGDRQLHRSAFVSPVGRNDVTRDVGSL